VWQRLEKPERLKRPKRPICSQPFKLFKHFEPFRHFYTLDFSIKKVYIGGNKININLLKIKKYGILRN